MIVRVQSALRKYFKQSLMCEPLLKYIISFYHLYEKNIILPHHIQVSLHIIYS